MVVGEFKRGKSTLINALLGEPVLPARVAPCTALITEVKYGPTPRAVLHPLGGEPAHEVPVERLREYLVIADEDEPGPARFAKMEVFHPRPILANNVLIIDSPGLNEHRVRNEIALDYLPKADALVLVLSCEQALSASELAFLEETVVGTDLRHVFFVWNRYDAVAGSARDIADLEARTARWLTPRVVPERVFYVTARDALTGRRTGDDEAVAASGLPPFETALEQFLTTERGRVKLSTPLAATDRAVREALTEGVPRREALMATPVEELRRRLEEQRPKLLALQRQRELLLTAVERRRDTLAREASASYTNLVARLGEGLPKAAEEVPLGLFGTMVSSRASQKKVAEHLQTWLEGQVAAWRIAELEPLVDRHLAELERDLDHRLREFLRDLDAVRRALTPEVHVPLPEGEDIPPISRVLGAVGGLLVGSLGAAVEGAGHGVGQMLKGLGYHVALSLGLLVLGAGAPVILGASLALGLVRTLWEGNAAIDRIRTRVAEEVGAGFRGDTGRVTSEMTDRLERQLSGLLGALDASMRMMIEEVDAQVRATLAEKERGEAELAEAKRALVETRRRLVSAAAALDALRVEAG